MYINDEAWYNINVSCYVTKVAYIWIICTQNPEKAKKEGRLDNVARLAGCWYEHASAQETRTRPSKRLFSRGLLDPYRLMDGTLRKWKFWFSVGNWVNKSIHCHCAAVLKREHHCRLCRQLIPRWATTIKQTWREWLLGRGSLPGASPWFGWRYLWSRSTQKFSVLRIGMTIKYATGHFLVHFHRWFLLRVSKRFLEVRY
jgi:hypothetical protein